MKHSDRILEATWGRHGAADTHAPTNLLRQRLGRIAVPQIVVDCREAIVDVADVLAQGAQQNVHGVLDIFGGLEHAAPDGLKFRGEG